ncbi:LOB domain-containing protein 24 [Abeliophyllum distichum]|uniref:LOB domain-containing protein 24 n=1 Tax=Abeliophyllum distichum TaxID=126358 RepID=A0ABD1S999_9LAMI
MASTRCAACKYLRRRCPSDCIFSLYFPSNNPQRFAYVHKIFGASNIGKMLQDLPLHRRADAADSLYYEAHCRIKDPVYGCVGIINILLQEIYNVQCQIAKIQAEIAFLGTHAQSDQTQYQQLQIAPNLDPNFLSEQKGLSNSFDDSSTWFF